MELFDAALHAVRQRPAVKRAHREVALRVTLEIFWWFQSRRRRNRRFGHARHVHACHVVALVLGHGTSPTEISAAVKFILSQPALTGQMIVLDGGQHLVWHTRDVTEVNE